MKTLSRITLFSLLSALTLTLASQAFAHGWTTPEEAINSYITAVKTGSGKHIDMAFTESASIQYYDDKDNYNVYTREEFKALVDTGNTWDAKIEITELKMTGKAANATVQFTWGKNGEHGYVDYLNLTFDKKKSWHITDKVAQYIRR